MTDLSPAAQAVMNAFGTYPLRAGNIGEDLIPALAAALRAAADQGSYCLDGSDYYVITKDDILAIAAELEGNHTSEND